MTIKYITSFLLCLLASGLFSCSEEEPGNLNNNEKQVTIALSIPGLERETSPTTYALPADEDKINTIDVLVFKTDPLFPDDPSKGTYYYHAAVAHTAESTTFTFTARFIGTSDRQTIVVLANCRTEVTTLLETISEGDSKADVIQALSLTQATAFNPVAMTGIPMWGEITNQDITASYNPTGLSVQLTRMLAKINIVNDDAYNFTLTEAYLYNPRQKGSVMPDNWERLNSSVTTPTIVLGSEMTQGSKFTFFGTTTTNKIEDQIYTFEVDNATKAVADRLNATCLVVGGKYQSNTSTVYYRIDLKDYARDVYFDILRNHSYNVTITSVTDEGVGNPDDAYKGRSTIKAQVEGWNQAMGNIQYGSSYLTVSKRHLWANLNGTTTAGANTFTVQTSDPEGWKVKRSPTWGKLTPTSGSISGVVTTVTFTADPTSSHPEGRKEEIVIQAGNLEYTLYVMQGNCGRSGVPLTQTIGSRTYKTHQYPTGTSGEMQCWMVENSKEGVGSGKGYGLDWAGAAIGDINNDGNPSHRGKAYGYYYAWGQRNNACPAGWSVPTKAQWGSLQTSIDINLQADEAIWWAGTSIADNVLTGSVLGGTDGISYTWYSWGVNCPWWVKEDNEPYLLYRGHRSGMIGPQTATGRNWFNVRCVRN
ncbi:MAG TPA: fimbrial protein [Bacteroides reticulotermitis]|nr:fimbrial protein [Bacteroides reticulotermitis]